MSYIDDINIGEYKIEYIENCPRFSNCHLKDCIPKNVCPFLLHTLVPYYLTYLHGGNFTWSKKIGHVDVQCPNPRGKVISDVVKNKNIYAVVKSSKNTCPMKYKTGAKINLSEVFKTLCPLVYDVAFPWMQLGLTDSITLRCPGCFGKREAKFTLRHDK